MKIKLKKLNENAVLPRKATSKDFCYDVVAVSEEEIAPNVWRYSLGFAYEIERDDIILGCWDEPTGTQRLTKLNEDGLSGTFEDVYMSRQFAVSDKYVNQFNLSIDFRPRSSVWKTGMVLSNCVGTLDELYRGEVMAVFYHVVPNMPRYKVGDRIGQIKLGLTLPLEFEFVENIDTNTDRGTGGFGSTGK